MKYNNEEKITLSKGPAAAHAYLMIDNNKYNVLTLDWSYDSVYFKYNDKWITLSIGSKTEINEIDKIDTDDKKKIFKTLAMYILYELPSYSIISDISLLHLQELISLL